MLLILLLLHLCAHAPTASSSPGATDSGDSGGGGGGGGGELLARAEQHYRAGQTQDALAALEQAASALPPEDPRPLVAIATVLLDARDGREREAVHFLQQAAELYRQHPQAGRHNGFGAATRSGLLANLATWLYQTGDSGGAILVCEEALVIQPLHARCYYIHGVSMLSSGRWRETGGVQAAESSLSASVRLFVTAPDRVNSMFALGSLRLRAGMMAPAAAAFESALRLAPDHHDVLMRTGEMRSRFARHAAALVAFQAAERLRPDHADAIIQCGNALRRLKRLSAALKKYQAAEGLPGASKWEKAEALYWIGSVREGQGKKSKAERAYRQALEAEPAHARALNNLGSMLMARNDDGARDLYQRATMADPHMFEAYNNLGGLLMVHKEPQKALPLLEFAYQLDQTEPQLIFNLGLARRQAAAADEGKGDRAAMVSGKDVAMMRQALRIRQDNKDYLWELARTYLYSNQSGLVLSTLRAMTNTLHSRWDEAGGSKPRGLDVDHWIHDSAETAGMRGFVAGEVVGAPAMPAVKGVILFLCCADQDELRDLHHSLRRLHAFFTSRFRYPVMVLHDNLTAREQRSLAHSFAPSSLSFVNISHAFQPPSHIGSAEWAAVPAKLLLAGHSWSHGYRHMSRFFCKGLFELKELVDQYDYYWRLDADSFLLGPVMKDPFATLKNSGREYGYMVVTQEDESVVKGLWNTTKEYMRLRGLTRETAGFLQRHLNDRGEWNRNMFYTNFEITSLAFWKSQAYRDFFDFVDQSNGIYMHRWGDAPIHLLAVALLLPEDKVLQFSDIAYWHQYYVNWPRELPWSA